jgi:hypothetical protein
MRHMVIIVVTLWFALIYQCVIYGNIVSGGEMSEEMKKMQDRLNNQVLSQPFSVADEAQVKAYIEGAQRRGEVPQPYKGKYWRPGYTCVDLRPYSYREYLSCRYYYSYYGRYYP